MSIGVQFSLCAYEAYLYARKNNISGYTISNLEYNRYHICDDFIFILAYMLNYSI